MDKLNKLLVSTKMFLSSSYQKYVRSTEKALKFLEDAHFVPLHQIINGTCMIHIVVEKVNKLLVYPHITFLWS